MPVCVLVAGSAFMTLDTTRNIVQLHSTMSHLNRWMALPSSWHSRPSTRLMLMQPLQHGRCCTGCDALGGITFQRLQLG